MLEQLLEAPANFALRQIVWTADTLKPAIPHEYTKWLEIADFVGKLKPIDGMKIVALRKYDPD